MLQFSALESKTGESSIEYAERVWRRIHMEKLELKKQQKEFSEVVLSFKDYRRTCERELI